MVSARMIGVGAFVIGGLLLFSIALFMIGERRMMFTSQFDVYTEFTRLSGLQQGAQVQVSGMIAGEVEDIVIPKTPAARFRVRMRIREDLHPLVRTDSVAAIRTEGLVGGQFVLVTAGSERAPEAPDESTIPSREPFDIGDLLEQAAATVRNVNETIVTLRGQVEVVLANIGTTVKDADLVINDVGVEVRSIATSGARVADDISAITAGVRAGRGTVGQLFANDDLYRKADAIVGEAERTSRNIREATDSAKRLLEDWSRKGGTAQSLTADLRDTLERARESLSNLQQNTEALKHNWFFSGYFKRRGYYSLSEISPEEYRRGALEQSGRTRLRVWLDASALFATQPDGSMALTDDGRGKLDSAMGSFLKYLGSGPLMIEGYAQEGASAQRYLESRRRAAAVRDHLLRRFSLNPDSVGMMPLGTPATGSPGGDSWDGIALAVFVSPDVVKQQK